MASSKQGQQRGGQQGGRPPQQGAAKQAGASKQAGRAQQQARDRARPEETLPPPPTGPRPPARLQVKYVDEVRPALIKELSYANVMQAPRVDKVIINVGIGSESKSNSAVTDTVAADLQ